MPKKSDRDFLRFVKRDFYENHAKPLDGADAARPQCLWHTTNAICCFYAKTLATQGHSLKNNFLLLYELHQLDVTICKQP
jgi:hypothetical protein